MKVKTSKKTKLLAIMLILIMLISVGYAFLSTQLTINGTATVKNQSWSIYFTNIVPTEGSVTPTTAPTASGTETTELTWAVSMDTPGQFYEFTVDAVNAGTIEAMIGNLSNSTLTTDQAKYLDYTVTYSDGAPIEQYDRLAPNGGIEKLKVRVEFKKDITAADLPATADQITLNYASQYVQADTTNAKTRTKYLSGATIKVDGTAIGNENVTMQKGATSVISLENTEGMENVTYSSSDTSVATVDSNGTITGVYQGTATITLTGATSGIERTFTLQVKKPLEIGDTVNYITSLNGVELKDKWRVFYVDGDYTYIIYNDYLPQTAISNTMRSTYNLANGNGTTGIKSTTNRTDLLNAMTTKSNWDELLTGTINGHAVNETRTENVWAMGSPTLDLWVDSWNKSYPDDRLYTAYANPVSGKTYDGYYIDLAENPDTNNKTYVNLSSKDGYNNTLYFPYKSDQSNVYGYWLASPSPDGARLVRFVSYGGFVDNGRYDFTNYAFAPVVCLPSSVVNQ